MQNRVPLLEEFDPGDEGVFQRVDKTLLRVDNGVSGYQRKKLEEKARQQRHAASLLIPSIKRVPCIVFGSAAATHAAGSWCSA